MMEDLLDTIGAACDFFTGLAPLDNALGEMECEPVFLPAVDWARGGGMAEDEDDVVFFFHSPWYTSKNAVFQVKNKKAKNKTSRRKINEIDLRCRPKLRFSSNRHMRARRIMAKRISCPET